MSFSLSLLAFPILSDLESLALLSLKTSPAAPPVCLRGNAENPALDLACLEDRYLAATEERPQILFNDPAPHCGRGTGLFSDRVYVTHGNEELLELNASRDPQAPGTRVRCEAPTLWQISHPGETQVLESGLLQYLQIKGKTVWVPDYLCNTLSYQGHTIRNKKDFSGLLERLKQPFLNEDRSIMSCYSSPEVAPEFSEDFSEASLTLIVAAGLELSLSLAAGSLAGVAISRSFSKIGSAVSKSISKAHSLDPQAEDFQEETPLEEEPDDEEWDDFEDEEIDSSLEDSADSV